MFNGHYHESMPRDLARLFAKRGLKDLEIDLWNAYVDSGLLDVCDDDVSVLPRILPASYLPAIRAAALDTTEFLMKFLSLPEGRLRKLLHATPVTNYLINRLGVLEHRPRRLVGSLRYDFAIEGPPRPDNPPRLFEINEIGFDGTGRSSFMQETLLDHFPELKKRVRSIDSAGNEVNNMLRLGMRLLRLQYNCYNWEEEVIISKARRRGLEIEMVSPEIFGLDIDEEYSLLRRAPVVVRKGRITSAERPKTSAGKPKSPAEKPKSPDAVQVSYSFDLSDYKEGRELFKKIIQSKTPHYSPFVTGLIAPKSTLLLLDNDELRCSFLGERRAKRLRKAIVPVAILSDSLDEVKRKYLHRVIKHADGMGGEQVFVGKKIPAKLRRIPKNKRREWVVQRRIRPNTIDVDGFLSRRRRVIADLGVFVQYDWDGKRFRSFRLGGFVTRATNRGLKVNVCGGGIQVPVLFDRRR